MAKLFWRYSPMNAGKSTALLQVAFNYVERDQRPVIAKPTTDTKSVNVSSRIGLEAPVDWNIYPDTNIIDDYFRNETGVPIDCILVDEAQFLAPEQVDQLFWLTVNAGIPVIAYGIRSDFQTRAFPGGVRLFELAHSIEEMKTVCRCGAKAIFNARMINGKFVTDGESVAIDQEGVGGEITYESMCGRCYSNRVYPIGATS